MTSLDDTIISRQNLMLLDNVTNYQRPAIDYFHHKFNENKLEIPLSWTLLLKMRKHKLLRLPSCSIEDDMDYKIYLVRLHHCLWRRWSIDYYHLDKCKADPLSINWNKETDVTVLYGPDLTASNNDNDNDTKQKLNKINDKTNTTITTTNNNILKHSMKGQSDIDSVLDENTNNYAYDTYSSSIDSNTSSIFDSNSNTCMKIKSNSSQGSNNSIKSALKSSSPSSSHCKSKCALKFKNTVLRRDIDKYGYSHESNIRINDVYGLRDLTIQDLIPRAYSYDFEDADDLPREHRHEHHHHHHHHHHQHDKCDSS